MSSKTMVVIAAGLLAMTLAACGGGDESNAERFDGDKKQVAEVIDELGAAAREGDTKRICEDLITVDLQRSVRETAGTSCAQEFEENIVGDDTRYTVDTIDVIGSQANAKVTDQDDRKSAIALVKLDGDWRIASIQ